MNGESAPYLGRDYRIEIAETASGEIELSRCFSGTRLAIRASVVRCCGIGILHAPKKRSCLVSSNTPAELGVKFAAAKIVDNRYRWGSCTVERTFNFNWRLIKAPMFVIDYVIVHELAHLIEPNHTPGFWGIVRASSPRMEKAKLWLREHGQLLEQEM